MMTDFPHILDSSILASWRSCRHKFNWEYLHHFKPRTSSVHLHAGAAYAKGIEVARKAYYQYSLPEEEAYAHGFHALMLAYGDFQCPPESAKSLQRMVGALEFYFASYPFASELAIPYSLPSGVPAIEFSFAEPLDILHPISGDPLLYCGRMDQIVSFADGVYGEDDKTTSQLGASWSKQWDLRSQFTGYCWGAGRTGIPLTGFLIRGVSILKTKYETQQAITYRQPWMIEEWYEGLLEDVEEMITAWKKEKFRKNLDHACTEYGGCIFKTACMSQNPASWLNLGFERREWKPLTREEVLWEPVQNAESL